MRFTKPLVTAGLPVLAIVGLLGFAPRAVHAAVAALVLVSNTAANPAIVSNIDNPGRTAYQASQQTTTGGVCSSNSCTFSFAAVPAGHRLVVQSVSMAIQAKSMSVPTQVSLTNGAFSAIPFGVFFPATVQLSTGIVLDQPVNAYFDAGETPTLSIGANIDTSGFGLGLSQQAALFGYMLDCTASACSAIVRN
jgi:hypothetical protein